MESLISFFRQHSSSAASKLTSVVFNCAIMWHTSCSPSPFCEQNEKCYICCWWGCPVHLRHTERSQAQDQVCTHQYRLMFVGSLKLLFPYLFKAPPSSLGVYLSMFMLWLFMVQVVQGWPAADWSGKVSDLQRAPQWCSGLDNKKHDRERPGSLRVWGWLTIINDNLL